jgi:hypothetical protein
MFVHSTITAMYFCFSPKFNPRALFNAPAPSIQEPFYYERKVYIRELLYWETPIIDRMAQALCKEYSTLPWIESSRILEQAIGETQVTITSVHNILGKPPCPWIQDDFMDNLIFDCDLSRLAYFLQQEIPGTNFMLPLLQVTFSLRLKAHIGKINSTLPTTHQVKSFVYKTANIQHQLDVQALRFYT